VDSDHVRYVCVKSMLPSSGARRSRYTRSSVHPGFVCEEVFIFAWCCFSVNFLHRKGERILISLAVGTRGRIFFLPHYATTIQRYVERIHF